MAVFVACNSGSPKQTTAVNYNLIMQQLDSIHFNDQFYRKRIDSLEKLSQHYSNVLLQSSHIATKQDSDNVKKVSDDLNTSWSAVNKSDASNLIKVKTIIDTYGWLGADVIGSQANQTLFLVIQHGGLAVQEKYLPIMKEAAKNKKADPAELALLIDRIEVSNNRPQIYGSQIKKESGKFVICPIIDEVNVNKRRSAVGLSSLEEYAKNWNINYKLPAQ